MSGPVTAGVQRYAKRNAQALGQLYCDHVHAMTVEGLHEKSDIAAELAWRDAREAQLTALVEQAEKALTLAESTARAAGQLKVLGERGYSGEWLSMKIAVDATMPSVGREARAALAAIRAGRA